jgi:hypothetical protein
LGIRSLAAELLEIPPEVVDTALELELAAGAVVADTVEERPCVFLAGLYRAEQGIAERLRGLVAASLPWPAIDADKAIPWAEEGRDHLGREPARGGMAGATLQAAGDYRRSPAQCHLGSDDLDSS